MNDGKVTLNVLKTLGEYKKILKKIGMPFEVSKKTGLTKWLRFDRIDGTELKTVELGFSSIDNRLNSSITSIYKENPLKSTPEKKIYTFQDKISSKSYQTLDNNGVKVWKKVPMDGDYYTEFHHSGPLTLPYKVISGKGSTLENSVSKSFPQNYGKENPKLVKLLGKMSI